MRGGAAHDRLGWGIPDHVTALPVDGDPIAALRAVAFYLERERAETYRVKAYRSAAERLAELDPDDVAARARAARVEPPEEAGGRIRPLAQ